MAILRMFEPLYAPLQDMIYETVISVRKFGGANRSQVDDGEAVTYTDNQRFPAAEVILLYDDPNGAPVAVEFWVDGNLAGSIEGPDITPPQMDAQADALFDIGWAPYIAFGVEGLDNQIATALSLFSSPDRDEGIGTSQGDAMRTMGDFSVLRAGGGDDLLIAGTGQHRYDGGGGRNDRVDFQELFGLGADVDLGARAISLLDAETGDTAFRQTIKAIEHVTGSFYDDTITGDAKRNKLDAGDGDDTVEGGGGNDRIRGEKGHDTLSGGDGNDNLLGGRGRDYIDGGDGDDKIKGGSSADILLGGSGDDEIAGGNGNDDIRGGSGDDTITDGKGRDYIEPGKGNDTVILRADDLFETDRIVFRVDLDDDITENDQVQNLGDGDKIVLVDVNQDHVQISGGFDDFDNVYTARITIVDPGSIFDGHTINVRGRPGEDLGLGGGGGEHVFKSLFIEFATSDDPA